MKDRNLNKTLDLFIQQENILSSLMIDEIISNKKVKAILKKSTNKIITHVLNPLQHVISSSNFQSLAEVPEYVKNSIKILAVQNIDDEIPFGGILQGFKKADTITASYENINKLLSTYQYIFSKIDNIKSQQDVLKLLKSIADLSFCYFEYFTDQHSSEFNCIKDMIWLTPEESDARILRTELNQENQLAVTYGINREEKTDLQPAIFKIGINSGKALFAGASMHARLEIITKQFDQLVNLSTKPITENEEKKLHSLIKKMQYYKIPLNSEARQSIEVYAKQSETTFEKLAKRDKETHWPLVANISRSTARTIITMQDLHLFNLPNGEFDFENAQIFANSLIAFYVWGGHHSYTEVAEIYNRLLDYISIQHCKTLPNDLIKLKLSKKPYFKDDEALERILPYYHIGDYSSFLHREYAQKFMKVNDSEEFNSRLKL